MTRIALTVLTLLLLSGCGAGVGGAAGAQAEAQQAAQAQATRGAGARAGGSGRGRGGAAAPRRGGAEPVRGGRRRAALRPHASAESLAPTPAHGALARGGTPRTAARRLLLRGPAAAGLRAAFLRVTFLRGGLLLAVPLFWPPSSPPSCGLLSSWTSRPSPPAPRRVGRRGLHRRRCRLRRRWPARGSSCTAKAPPCGSRNSAIQLPPGTSTGPCRSRPPAALAAATARFESATCT